ncbi:MAG: hypothetical protein WA775_00950 [Psychroserpens sp.]|uniref:hypothetical protein n=1 Tax=Psychroserpens sp. TaxID=2020870 RepID=UPI003C794696
MKLFSTLIIALSLSFSTVAQSHKTEITKHAQTYFNYITTQNFDGVLDYMYPKVFDLAPKDQMKAAMQQMFNSPEMKIEFLSNTISKVSEEKIVDDITYAAVFYNSKMKMTFVSEMDKEEADKIGFLDFMKGTMETQFGEGNVESNLEAMSLIVTMDSNMFAIKDPTVTDWKFIGNDDAMKQLVNTIVPKAVREELIKN